jgi:hypothetical protein
MTMAKRMTTQQQIHDWLANAWFVLGPPRHDPARLAVEHAALEQLQQALWRFRADVPPTLTERIYCAEANQAPFVWAFRLLVDVQSLDLRRRADWYRAYAQPAQLWEYHEQCRYGAAELRQGVCIRSTYYAAALRLCVSNLRCLLAQGYYLMPNPPPCGASRTLPTVMRTQ